MCTLFTASFYLEKRFLKMYIYEHENWPNFEWNSDILLPLLGRVRNAQGLLIGKLEALGFENLNDALLETLTLDVLKTTEIEGEILSKEQVRSSLARHLGISIPNEVQATRDVDGIVELTLDATQNYNKPLDQDRIFGWHCGLFPTGRSGLYKIVVGNWRDGANGPMQVVSGSAGNEKIHFEAPCAKNIPSMMNDFINWFNEKKDFDPIIFAAIAHLYFITLHPLEDGNGRIARAITDMLLARADGMSQRFYSMSAQIMNQRKEYYDILEKTQKDNLDITEWLVWFFNCLMNSISYAETVLEKVLQKYRFWQKQKSATLNDRQKKMLNLLLEDFKGKLNTSKWAKITKCSSDTALRDIQDLLDKGILKKEAEGGRSTNYTLVKLPR